MYVNVYPHIHIYLLNTICSLPATAVLPAAAAAYDAAIAYDATAVVSAAAAVLLPAPGKHKHLAPCNTSRNNSRNSHTPSLGYIATYYNTLQHTHGPMMQQ